MEAKLNAEGGLFNMSFEVEEGRPEIHAILVPERQGEYWCLRVRSIHQFLPMHVCLQSHIKFSMELTNSQILYYRTLYISMILLEVFFEFTNYELCY